MVGHDIEHLAQTSDGQPAGQPAMPSDPPELVVQPPVVDHVVAMGAALGRLQVGRAVEVADAQSGQIVDYGGRVVEGKSLVQLHAVSRSPPAPHPAPHPVLVRVDLPDVI